MSGKEKRERGGDGAEAGRERRNQERNCVPLTPFLPATRFFTYSFPYSNESPHPPRSSGR